MSTVSPPRASERLQARDPLHACVERGAFSCEEDFFSLSGLCGLVRVYVDSRYVKRFAGRGSVFRAEAGECAAMKTTGGGWVCRAALRVWVRLRSLFTQGSGRQAPIKGAMEDCKQAGGLLADRRVGERTGP